MPSSKLTSTKRLAVRLSLVTGSTLATIIGAQSLAALDMQSTSAPESQAALDSLTIDTTVRTAPTITILRHAGTTQNSANTTTAAIQPPSPIQLAPPDPVIVQVPSDPIIVQQQSAPVVTQTIQQPRTRSSR